MRTTSFCLSILVAISSVSRAADPTSPPAFEGTFQNRSGAVTGSSSVASGFATSNGASTPTMSFQQSTGLGPEMIDRHSEAARKLLIAITAADFPGFLFQGDKRFQTFELDKFNALSRTWASRFSSGFGVTYLGELRRQAAATTLWRVRLNDKSGDALVIIESDKRGSVSDVVLF